MKINEMGGEQRVYFCIFHINMSKEVVTVDDG